MGGRETAIQRPKIWQARMTASLRMMAALRPMSTKEIDRIRDAQPTGLSGCGKTRSRTASRSALINPPQEIRVVLRSWRHQIVCEAGDKRLARSPARKRILLLKDSCPWRPRRGGAPFAADYCFESASMYLSGLASNATSCSFMQK
jgi:microcystin degradation protein MlrC